MIPEMKKSSDTASKQLRPFGPASAFRFYSKSAFILSPPALYGHIISFPGPFYKGAKNEPVIFRTRRQKSRIASVIASITVKVYGQCISNRDAGKNGGCRAA
jgi:hypothetical protein